MNGGRDGKKSKKNDKRMEKHVGDARPTLNGDNSEVRDRKKEKCMYDIQEKKIFKSMFWCACDIWYWDDTTFKDSTPAPSNRCQQKKQQQQRQTTIQ